ncbi:MAG TPA: hemerythrin domain-containing protein [Vicinamibacteria bacterium]|nr:hemerythrin domain-containing protein [Vicinamibacteria bacterium]
MTIAMDVPERLDCNRIAVQGCPEVVLDAFDALPPGSRLRLICAQAPVSALEALRRERRGAFEWSPVREGPACWEIDVERRAAPVGSLREVTEALVWDHARLDALEGAAFEARARGHLMQAREIFTDFAHGLRRHIEFEEALLFPAFDTRCRLEGCAGPSEMMRAEHRAILCLLAVMEREIDDDDAPIELSRAELRRIQRDHDLKEERILYPALDRMLDEEEGDEMVARIQRWGRG